MAFKSWAAMVLVGAALGLAGPMLPARAQTQNYTPKTLVIVSPAAGASVSSPVTVSFSLGNNDTDAGPPPGSPHHARQAYLVVDSAAAAGDAIQADATHIAFPTGQQQISVALATGQHQLQVVVVNREGQVSSRVLPSAPVTVTVH